VHGPQFAIEELRDQIGVEIWKNSFIYYTEDDEWNRKSARIGITVGDGDPELAFDIAHDVASIVIATHEEQRRTVNAALTRKFEMIHHATQQRVTDVNNQIATKQTEATLAAKHGKSGLTAALYVDLAALAAEKLSLDAALATIAASPEALADQMTRAGLDTTIEVVGERRPEHQEQSQFVLVLIAAVIGVGVLLGASVFLGAFDSRVHDPEDVSRLGLPVLGHVPGFAGDNVGSLQARGARRRRVPSFLRWRFHR
jgi:capsular polysaccharide biosynthesis protein